jgi:2-hydroxy-3-keto-5-methylthiopentenyl-1-phosphate phosphatase
MGRDTPSKVVLLCDFDGTIMNIDTAQFVLDRFADHSWRLIDEQFERGEISFEESLRKEFSMITAPEKEILRELHKVAFLRANFDKLVEYCKTLRLPLIVVSGGLDFCIRHFLDQKNWLRFMGVCAPKSKRTPNGYTLTFPKLFDENSVSFKDDLVKHCRKQRKRVLYVGNGAADYPAVKKADFSFAIRSSRLAELCSKGDIRYKEISDFQEVIDTIVDSTASQTSFI